MKPTITRYFTKRCSYCPSVNICATYERETSNRVGDYRCCMCNEVWEEPILTYVFHAESESAFPVTSEKELRECLDQGCNQVSEYFCTMVELGLWSEIDFEYEKQLRMKTYETGRPTLPNVQNHFK